MGDPLMREPTPQQLWNAFLIGAAIIPSKADIWLRSDRCDRGFPIGIEPQQLAVDIVGGDGLRPGGSAEIDNGGIIYVRVEWRCFRLGLCHFAPDFSDR
jgi:hypothetical protein